MSTSHEAVIGLEVHAQLKTRSKIFCGCSTRFDAEENINTCPICTGMPGSLPVLNKVAVAYALKMAVATHCHINPISVFSRKNYFYPDLPKGYQISQYDKPLAEKGYVEIETRGKKKKIRLGRIHMEEDAGKNVHRANKSYLNLNRAGLPLIEIVSEPDMKDPEEASTYLKELRKILRYLAISDGNMEEGNFRCDVNVSLRPVGDKKFGTRTEIKNINSFRFVEKAITYEVERQTELLNSGRKVVQETRLWDTERNKTVAMRSKEEAHDYRYFPDPDLLPFTIDETLKKEIIRGLPELPSEKKTRFMQDYGLSDYDASLLVQEREVADYFEAAVDVCKNSKLVSNWILSELLREFDMNEISTCLVKAWHLGELISMIEKKVISGKIAKVVFEKMIKSGQTPKEIVESEGWVQISDEALVSGIIDDVLKTNEEAIQKYQSGNQKVLGFFVGEVMRITKGKADPTIVNKVLREKLEKK